MVKRLRLMMVLNNKTRTDSRRRQNKTNISHCSLNNNRGMMYLRKRVYSWWSQVRTVSSCVKVSHRLYQKVNTATHHTPNNSHCRLNRCMKYMRKRVVYSSRAKRDSRWNPVRTVEACKKVPHSVPHRLHQKVNNVTHCTHTPNSSHCRLIKYKRVMIR